MNSQDKLPRLYGAVVLVFSSAHLSPQVVELLPANVEVNEYADCIEVVYSQLDNIFSWEIDDLLTQLFANCDLKFLSDLISSHNVSVLIDISFHHYGRFPAIVFEGQNMQIIHALQADISIDPY